MGDPIVAPFDDPYLEEDEDRALEEMGELLATYASMATPELASEIDLVSNLYPTLNPSVNVGGVLMGLPADDPTFQEMSLMQHQSDENILLRALKGTARTAFIAFDAMYDTSTRIARTGFITLGLTDQAKPFSLMPWEAWNLAGEDYSIRALASLLPGGETATNLGSGWIPNSVDPRTREEYAALIREGATPEAAYQRIVTEFGRPVTLESQAFDPDDPSVARDARSVNQTTIRGHPYTFGSVATGASHFLEPGSIAFQTLSTIGDGAARIFLDPANAAFKQARVDRMANRAIHAPGVVTDFHGKGSAPTLYRLNPAWRGQPGDSVFGGFRADKSGKVVQTNQSLSQMSNPNYFERGLLWGPRRSAYTRNYDEIVATPEYQELFDVLANNNSMSRTRQLLQRKGAPALSRRVIQGVTDARTREGVNDVIRGQMGQRGGLVNRPLSTSLTKETMRNSKIANALGLGRYTTLSQKLGRAAGAFGDEFGQTLGHLGGARAGLRNATQNHPWGRLFAEMPSQTMSTSNFDDGLGQIDDWMMTNNFPLSSRDGYLEDLLDLPEDASQDEIWSVVKRVFDELEKKLKSEGVPDHIAHRIANAFDTMDEMRKYFISEATGDPAFFQGAEFTEGGFRGIGNAAVPVGRPKATAHLLQEYLQSNIPLPDARKLRHAMTRVGKITGIPTRTRIQVGRFRHRVKGRAALVNEDLRNPNAFADFTQSGDEVTLRFADGTRDKIDIKEFQDKWRTTEYKTERHVVPDTYSQRNKVDTLETRAAERMMDHYMSRFWKPAVLLRIAWPIRVIGEEQLRMGAADLDSLFNHPLRWLGWTLQENSSRILNNVLDTASGGRVSFSPRGQRSVFGGLPDDALHTWGFDDAMQEQLMLRTSEEAKRAMNSRGQNMLYRQQRGGSTRHHYIKFERGKQGYSAAWGGELRQLTQDEIAQHVARNGTEATVTWLRDTARGQRLLDQFVRTGGEGKKALKNSEVAVSLGYTSADDALASYVESINARIHIKTGGVVELRGPDGNIVPSDHMFDKTNLAGYRYSVVDAGNDDLLKMLREGKLNGIDVRDTKNLRRWRKFVDELDEKFPDVGPSFVKGPKPLEDAVQGFNRYDQIVDDMFNLLMGRPTNFLSRSPAFNQFYWRRVQELFPYTDPTTRRGMIRSAEDGNLPPDDIRFMRNIHDASGTSLEPGMRPDPQTQGRIQMAERFNLASDEELTDFIMAQPPDEQRAFWIKAFGDDSTLAHGLEDVDLNPFVGIAMSELARRHGDNPGQMRAFIEDFLGGGRQTPLENFRGRFVYETSDLGTELHNRVWGYLGYEEFAGVKTMPELQSAFDDALQRVRHDMTQELLKLPEDIQRRMDFGYQKPAQAAGDTPTVFKPGDDVEMQDLLGYMPDETDIPHKAIRDWINEITTGDKGVRDMGVFSDEFVDLYNAHEVLDQGYRKEFLTDSIGHTLDEGHRNWDDIVQGGEHQALYQILLDVSDQITNKGLDAASEPFFAERLIQEIAEKLGIGPKTRKTEVARWLKSVTEYVDPRDANLLLPVTHLLYRHYEDNYRQIWERAAVFPQEGTSAVSLANYPKMGGDPIAQAAVDALQSQGLSPSLVFSDDHTVEGMSWVGETMSTPVDPAVGPGSVTDVPAGINPLNGNMEPLIPFEAGKLPNEFWRLDTEDADEVMTGFTVRLSTMEAAPAFDNSVYVSTVVDDLGFLLDENGNLMLPAVGVGHPELGPAIDVEAKLHLSFGEADIRRRNMDGAHGGLTDRGMVIEIDNNWINDNVYTGPGKATNVVPILGVGPGQKGAVAFPSNDLIIPQGSFRIGRNLDMRTHVSDLEQNSLLDMIENLTGEGQFTSLDAQGTEFIAQGLMENMIRSSVAKDQALMAGDASVIPSPANPTLFYEALDDEARLLAAFKDTHFGMTPDDWATAYLLRRFWKMNSNVQYWNDVIEAAPQLGVYPMSLHFGYPWTSKADFITKMDISSQGPKGSFGVNTANVGHGLGAAPQKIGAFPKASFDDIVNFGDESLEAADFARVAHPDDDMSDFYNVIDFHDWEYTYAVDDRAINTFDRHTPVNADEFPNLHDYRQVNSDSSEQIRKLLYQDPNDVRIEAETIANATWASPEQTEAAHRIVDMSDIEINQMKLEVWEWTQKSLDELGIPKGANMIVWRRTRIQHPSQFIPSQVQDQALTSIPDGLAGPTASLNPEKPGQVTSFSLLESSDSGFAQQTPFIINRDDILFDRTAYKEGDGFSYPEEREIYADWGDAKPVHRETVDARRAAYEANLPFRHHPDTAGVQHTVGRGKVRAAVDTDETVLRLREARNRLGTDPKVPKPTKPGHGKPGSRPGLRPRLKTRKPGRKPPLEQQKPLIPPNVARMDANRRLADDLSTAIANGNGGLPWADDLVAAIDEGVPPDYIARNMGRNAGEGVPYLNLQDIDDSAKAFALEQTKRLLYDLSKRNQMMDMLRNVFPFGEAWIEILTTWSRLMYENPNLFRQAQVGIEQARNAGVFTTDPNTGEEYFNYPGGGILADWMFGEGSNIGIQLRGRTQGLNLMTGQYIPGFGPAVQIPASYFQNPRYDDIKRLILPFGELRVDQAGDILNSLIPPWARKLLSAIGLRDPEMTRLHNNLTIDILRGWIAEGEMGNTEQEWADNWERANTMASKATFFRGFFQMGLPTGPEMVFSVEDKSGAVWLYQSLAKEYDRMIKEDFDGDEPAAWEKFQEMFGVDPLAFATPKTVQLYPRATTQAGDRFFRDNQDLFADGAFPLTAYFAQPDDPEEPFDYGAYIDAINDGDRVPVTPQQHTRMWNDTLARLVYDNARNQADTMFGESNTEPKTAWLKFYREFLRDKFPGYGRSNVGLPEKATIAMKIEELERWETNDKLKDTEAGQGLALYLRAREQIHAITRELGYDPASLNRDIDKLRPVQALLRQRGMQIAKEHPDFGHLWVLVLQYELHIEDAPDSLPTADDVLGQQP